MKLFLSLTLGLIIGYFLFAHKSVSSEVTYSDHGIKTVVTICDKYKECLISAGQECENSGYKVVDTDHDDMKTILTVECGKVKESSILSFEK